MKTIVKTIGFCTAAILLAIVPFACKKENMNGSMTVRMTDAPANFVQVNVDVTGLEIHHEANGWMSIPINVGIYNLLDLQNDVNVILANNVKLPVGKVNQMRLILGANNSLVDSTTTTYPLDVPSGSESGLKINIDQVITSNNNLQILLDFDANASIVSKGNGGYSLKPVLKLKSVIQ